MAKNGYYYFDADGKEYRQTETNARTPELKAQIKASQNGAVIDGNKFRIIVNNNFKPWNLGMVGHRFYRDGKIVSEKVFI
jgi:hypothetical protein